MQRFSVVIPVYNVKPYLRPCLDSVIAAAEKYQSSITIPIVEVICVDDGSTDGSAAVLDEYQIVCQQSRNFIFRVIHQANSGVSSARNTALNVATGEWICFVDSDDLVGLEYFIQIANAIAICPAVELIGFGLSRVNFDVDFKPKGDGKIVLLNIRNVVAGCIVSRGFCQFAYRRDLITGIEFPPFAFGEDLVWLCVALSRARSVAVVEYCGYGYRHRSGSAMTQLSTPQDVLNVIEVRTRMFGAFQNAQKLVPKAFVRGYGNAWLERTPYIIRSHWTEPGWREVWPKWMDSMVVARRFTVFTLWMRFVATVVAVTRSDIVALLLCVFPHYLKRYGFHR